MDPSTRLTVTLAAAAAAVFVTAGMVVRVRRWRQRSPEEIERLRRLAVNLRGRITTGQITDWIEPEAGRPGPRLVLYKYEITGASYEVAQDVSALPSVAAQVRSKVGRTVSIKYDPRVPTNSIVACEEWSGVPEMENGTMQDNSSVQSSAGALEKS